MKTLYLDCGMGAAGDMLAAALLELLPDPAAFVETLRGLGLPGVGFTLEKSVKCGVTGSHLAVTVAGQEEGEEHPHSHDHHGHRHEHRNLHDIRHLVEDHLQLPEAVRAVIRREKLYKKEVSANEPQTGKGACAQPLER